MTLLAPEHVRDQLMEVHARLRVLDAEHEALVDVLRGYERLLAAKQARPMMPWELREWRFEIGKLAANLTRITREEQP